MKGLYKALTALVLSGVMAIAQAAALNINSASADEIANAMSGVGDTKARAIVAFREENGAFLSIDDLVQVSGIGETLLERNRDNLVLE